MKIIIATTKERSGRYFKWVLGVNGRVNERNKSISKYARQNVRTAAQHLSPPHLTVALDDVKAHRTELNRFA